MKPSVLFVCVHNAGRSQMAQGFLTHLAGDRIDVRSAGTEPADRINPVAAQAMREVGIDITAGTPAVLTPAPSASATSSSPWAAATPARTSPVSTTATGNWTTRPGETSRPCGASATKSVLAWNN